MSYSLIMADPVVNVQHPQLIDSYTGPLPQETKTIIEPHFNQNQIVNLNLTSTINSSINLNRNDSHLIPSSPYQRNLQINEPKSVHDLFDFSSILIPKLNDFGSGDLIFQAIESNTQLQFAINASIYTSYISTPLDIVVSGTEYLELKIDDLAFNFNTDDFAFANLVIEFNNFNLLMVYEHSQSYIDFGFDQNSTESIKILNSLTSNTKINISDLVSQHNLNQPNLIKSISWDIYSNNPYDFSVIFSTMKFIGSLTPNVIINDEYFTLSTGQNITLDPDTSYSINTTTDNSFVEFQARIDTVKVIKEIFSINFKDYKLRIDGTLFLDDSDLGNFITVNFPNNIIIDMINTSLPVVLYKDNLMSFDYSQKFPIQFSAHFTVFENIVYNITEASQGSILKLTIFEKQLMGSKVVGPNNENGNVKSTNSTFEYSIPSNWDRGDIFIILWFTNGGFSYFSRTLDLYPSKLVSPNSYLLNVGERAQIPITMQNLTSLEHKNANNINSYYQGELFSVDNQNGITINPGDFPEGTHLLLVNATYDGLAPLVFELKIIINQFNPDITYTITRNEVNMISINFSIQEVHNWSVSSFMTITGEGIYQSFEFWKSRFEIQLINSNWTNSELEFDLIISLDDNLGVKHQKIIVSPFEDNPSNKNKSNNENSIMLVIGFISVTSGLGFVGYRFIKNNFGTEKISF